MDLYGIKTTWGTLEFPRCLDALPYLSIQQRQSKSSPFLPSPVGGVDVQTYRGLNWEVVGLGGFNGLLRITPQKTHGGRRRENPKAHHHAEVTSQLRAPFSKPLVSYDDSCWLQNTLDFSTNLLVEIASGLWYLFSKQASKQ